MKPAPFEYVDARSLDEAVALLARHGDEAWPLAGGQSLVPLMNMRLARPRVVVDLNRVESLAYIRESDGGLVVAASYILLTIGAVAVLLSACVAIYDTNWPILGQFAGLFNTGPFHSFPAQVGWMLDQVFPVATCVAVLLGRLTYLKLLALAYVVYMAFYKSKPA